MGRRRGRWSRLVSRFCVDLSDAAVPARAAGVIADRFVQVFDRELRPIGVAHMNLRVTDLPEQVVRDPALACGANEQVGVGKPGCVEVFCDGVFVDRLRIDVACTHLLRDRAHSVGDFGARSVVERERERQPGAVAGGADGFIKFGKDRFGQALTPADLDEAHVMVGEFLSLGDELLKGELHECCDFLGRSLPVFEREGVEREHFNAEPPAFGDGVAHGARAGAVTGGAREVALRGPPAVAIHDDGDVPRPSFEGNIERRDGGWDRLGLRHTELSMNSGMDRRRIGRGGAAAADGCSGRRRSSGVRP